jgi:hypothetical protein
MDDRGGCWCWQDEKRRQAMYSRRAALLQPILDEIHPKAFEGRSQGWGGSWLEEGP